MNAVRPTRVKTYMNTNSALVTAIVVTTITLLAQAAEASPDSSNSIPTPASAPAKTTVQHGASSGNVLNRLHDSEIQAPPSATQQPNNNDAHIPVTAPTRPVQATASNVIMFEQAPNDPSAPPPDHPKPKLRAPITPPTLPNDVLSAPTPTSSDLPLLVRPQTNNQSPMPSSIQLPNTGTAPVFASPSGPTSLSPPTLPNRPAIPVPPAVTLLPPRISAPRPPLAWRARAYDLTNSLHGTKYSGVRIVRDFTATPDDTFTALAQACDQTATLIEGISSPARQLSVRSRVNGQDKVAIVFTADAGASGGTTVVVGLIPDSRNFKTDTIMDILNRTESILNNKGTL